MRTIDCAGKTTREINQAIKALASAGEPEILLENPAARHNLAVAVLQPVRIVMDGSVGYYCAGMLDGAQVEVRGSAGWGLAECMLSGTVIVDGHAGNGAAASIRGGTVVVRGDAAARGGITMKGGLLLIGGAAGYMTGFMMQRGTIIICGDAGPALADSMYEGVVYVGGEIAELGNDTLVSEAPADELVQIRRALDRYGLKGPDAFRKVVSARKLWNYDKKDFEVWKAAF
ncbi:MAG: glutamate synthase [Nitrospinae bacterium]|nr:glutamate synthase [Nitrospinota bacterium]